MVVITSINDNDLIHTRSIVVFFITTHAKNKPKASIRQRSLFDCELRVTSRRTDAKKTPNILILKEKKVRPHQLSALDKVHGISPAHVKH